MKVETALALDRLAADARCIGAAFTTYTFDASFFEDHVLRAVLQIPSDPETSAALYRDEALASLQETPVVCFVDASMRPPGHTLPFDLREVRQRVFHPKLALLMYDTFARLSVASGNLTESGYGGNAETFFVHNLQYDDPSAAAALREVAGFLEALHELAVPDGSQTQLVLGELARRIEKTPPATDTSFAFLHTEHETPLLERFFALLPPKARIERIGVMAPFFERDDVTGDPADDMTSVVLTLAKRGGNKVTFDIAVGWDDAPIVRSGLDQPAIESRFGSLWALVEDVDEVERIRYFTPHKATPANYKITDSHGAARTVPKSELDKAVAQGRCWPAGIPQVFAPKTLVETARAEVAETHVWLHPRRTLEDKRVIERPLHAKMISIAYSEGSKTRTLVLVGSANASRKALLLPPAQLGNVEACVAFIVDGMQTLHDLAPELNYCAVAVEWTERAFPELEPLPSIPMVESATFDAKSRRLTITWSPSDASGMQITSWTLLYQDTVLFSGDGPPSQPTTVEPFDLSGSSCEVIVRAHDGERSFPITVVDLTALPFSNAEIDLRLQDLIAMMGQHISVERFKTIIARHGRTMLDATLQAVLGETFAPTDVFRAWWTIARDLASDGLSLAGFRLRLLGSIGPAAAWERMRALAGSPELRTEEVWFYGCELRRTLRAVVPPIGPDQQAKLQVLNDFLENLSKDLVSLAPKSSLPWVQRIVTFYEGAQP